MEKLAEQVIVDIIAQEMSLDSSQNIWIRNQNKVVPNDEGLYVVVGMVDANHMSSETYMTERGVDPDVEQLEINEVQLREVIQIDILSRSNDALSRRWEIIAALRSIYSQQKQEEYNFKIFRAPTSFINASIAEGGSQLNRFSLSFPCFVWYRKEKVLDPAGGDYYDDFDTEVEDEATIDTPNPLISFNITAEE